MKKHNKEVFGPKTFIILPVILTLVAFSFVWFSWMDNDAAFGQEQESPISLGYILEYRQDCSCEWPPFSGQCFDVNSCQINVNTNRVDNVVCVQSGNFGQWENSCGNGVVDCAEICDPTDPNASQRSYCDAFFGDQEWYFEEGKEQSCTSTCSWDGTTVYTVQDCGGYCGDGLVQTTLEGCESDGNGTSANDQYLCEACQFTGGFCGDDIVQLEFGEQCDGQVGVNEGEVCQVDCSIICAEGFHFEAGACISDVQPCDDESGQGTGEHTWDAEGESYGACVATQCNQFYKIENDDCVLNTCQIFDHDETTLTGTGIAEFNEELQLSGQCVHQVACNNPETHRQHQRNDGTIVCEPVSCVGPDSQTCQVENGLGFQTRSCDINSHPPIYSQWGECQITSCFEGYVPYEGICEPETCIEPLEENCSALIPNSDVALRSRPCIEGHPPTPGEWGACTVQTCQPGYRIFENTCELASCTGEQNIDCTAQKTNATLAQEPGTCNLEAHPPVYEYDVCTVVSCRPGFEIDVASNSCQLISYDVTGSAWYENAGWLLMNPQNPQDPNFQSVFIRAFEVPGDNIAELGGHAWNTNIGWINFAGVTVTAGGQLVGDALYTYDIGLGEQTYRLNLNPTCGGDPACGVVIGPDGVLRGYAWDEVFGWLNFNGANINVITDFPLGPGQVVMQTNEDLGRL